MQQSAGDKINLKAGMSGMFSLFDLIRHASEVLKPSASILDKIIIV